MYYNYYIVLQTKRYTRKAMTALDLSEVLNKPLPEVIDIIQNKTNHTFKSFNIQNENIINSLKKTAFYCKLQNRTIVFRISKNGNLLFNEHHSLQNLYLDKHIKLSLNECKKLENVIIDNFILDKDYKIINANMIFTKRKTAMDFKLFLEKEYNIHTDVFCFIRE
jgi:hypothetical protein